MKNKKGIKIAAGIAAVLLIVVVLSIADAFVGNPITAKMADNAIGKYIKDKYPSLNLELEGAKYDFKNGSYYSIAKSRDNIDIHFSVYYRNGKVQRDDYETNVLGMYNTLQRLSDEYSVVARSLIADKLGYKSNTTMVSYDKSEFENKDKTLELGMKFDKSLPLDSEILIRLELPDYSTYSIAKVLTDAYKVFIDNGCIFNKYGLYAEKENMFVMVNNVTPDDIESGELVNLLEKVRNKDGAGKISFYVK